MAGAKVIDLNPRGDELKNSQGLAAPIDEGDLGAVYRDRLARRGIERARWARLERRVADARLVIFILGVLTAATLYVQTRINHWWLAVPVCLFVPLVLIHEPIRTRGERARRAVEFYSKGLCRLAGRWAGAGVSGLEYLDVDHAYAADLDLFGVGSMFERLCTARTRAGEETLAAWLLAPAPPETIHERQTAVVELRPRLDLREDLELLGAEVRAGIDPAALAAWGKAPRVFTNHSVLIFATLIAVAGTLALCGWAFLETGLLPLLAAFAAALAFDRWQSRPVASVLSALEARLHDLVLLTELLERLERESFEAPLARRVRFALETDGIKASDQIKTLARLVQIRDWQKNQFFLPLAVLWLWSIQLAVRIDAWRSRSGQAIGGWLAAVGELEALCALASYAAENPADPFPELISGPACFDGLALGHPLLPVSDCVTNDLTLGPVTRAYLVSGSNMSGKSTLLRTVGINAVLAQAGLPVRAARLRLTPLSIGATLRIQDSLQAGKSRFYAELTRVRELVERSRGPLPLLFLLDELFHGTNSHDRCVGAESVVRGLIDRGAIGLVTTHDLALAKIVENLAPAVVNVHFEDHLEEGKMSFDYRMRPGVVTHSNALALMRAIGLDV